MKKASQKSVLDTLWSTLENSLLYAQQELVRFLSSSNFKSALQLTFGDNVDIVAATSLIQHLAQHNSSELPKIQIVSAAEINGAQGAFAQSNNTIYVAQEFLQKNTNNIPDIAAVLLEEIGHFIDSQLKTTDTPGERGELFSDLVRGIKLSPQELQIIKVENDTAYATIDGQKLAIEQSNHNLGLVQGFDSVNDSVTYLDYGDNWQFSISGTGGTNNFVSVASNFTNVDLVLQLFDTYGDLLATSNTGTNQDKISLNTLPAGTYIATVYNYYGTSIPYPYYANYTLAINAPIALPDLTLDNNLSGWSSGLVISTQPSTYITAPVFTSNETLYIDWAVINQGLGATNGGFSDRLLLNGQVINITPFGQLNSGYYDYFTNFAIAPLAPGNYTLTLQIDYLNQIVESNKSNNVWSVNFTVNAAIPKDRFEPNNTPQTATPIDPTGGLASYSNLSIYSPQDLDWFKFTTTSTATLQDFINISFNAQAGNIDVILWYQYNGNWYPDYYDGNSTNSRTLYLAGLPAGNYYVEVGSYQGNTNPNYTLTINTPIITQPDRFNQSGKSNSTITTATSIAQEYIDDVHISQSYGAEFFQFQINGVATLNNFININFDSSQGNLGLALYDSNKNLLGYSDYYYSNYETLSLAGLTTGTYYAEIYSPYGSTNSYNLIVNAPGITPTVNSDISKSYTTFANALDLKTLNAGYQLTDLSIDTSTETDWFKFTINATGTAQDFVAIAFDTYKGDLDLKLFNSSQTLLNSSTGFRDIEQISLQGLAAGTYYVEIYGYNGTTNPSYTLDIHAPGSPYNNYTQSTATNYEEIKGIKTDSNLVVQQGNQNWFRFILDHTGTQNNSIFLNFVNGLGNINLKLYQNTNSLNSTSFNSSSPNLVSEGSGILTSNGEEISLAGLAAGEYYIQIQNNDTNDLNYDLTINATNGDQVESNNSLQTAYNLDSDPNHYVQNQGYNQVYISNPQNPLCIDKVGEENWFQFTLNQLPQDGNFAEIVLDATQGELDLELQDSSGKVLGSSYGVNNVQSINLSGLGLQTSTTYYLRVFSPSNATIRTNPDYELVLNAPLNSSQAKSTPTNTSYSAATQLSNLSNTLSHLWISQANQANWFQFNLDHQGTLDDSIGITFDSNLGQLDLLLYNTSNPNNPIQVSQGIGNSQNISLAGLAAGNYYIKVVGDNGVTNPDYSLSVNLLGNKDWTGETNNTAATATDLRNIQGLQTWNPLSIYKPGQDEWFKFTLTQNTTIDDYAQIAFDQSAGDLDFYLYSSTNTSSPIVNNPSVRSSNSEKIDLSGLNAGTYYLRVAGHNNATNPNYQLSINGPNDLSGTWNTPNNSQQSAFNLKQVQGLNAWSSLSINNNHAGNVDWYEFNTVAAGLTGQSVSIQYDNQQGNLLLTLLDANGKTIQNSSNNGNNGSQLISLQGLAAGTYYVTVTGQNSTSPNPNYSLVIDAPQVPLPDWIAQNKINVSTAANAFNLETINTTLSLGGLSISSAGQSEWFKFTLNQAPIRGQTVRIDFNHYAGNLKLDLYASDGTTQLADSSTGNDYQEISLYDILTQAGKGAGTYYIKVSGLSNTVTNPDYSLTISGIPQLQEDSVEKTNNNNTSVKAYDLRNLQQSTSAVSKNLIYTNIPGFANGMQLPSGQYTPQDILNIVNGTEQLSYSSLNQYEFGGPNSAQLHQLSNQWAQQGLAYIYSQDPLSQTPQQELQNYNSTLNATAPLYNEAQYLLPQAAAGPGLGVINTVLGLLGTPLPTSNNPNSLFGSYFSNPVNQYTTGQSGNNLFKFFGLHPNTVGGGGGFVVGSFVSQLLGGNPLTYSTQNLASIPNLAIQANDQEWFKFELSSDGQPGQFVSIAFDQDLGALELDLYEASNPTTPIVTAKNNGDSEQIDLAGLAQGTYYVKVSGITPTTTNPNYSLIFNATPPLQKDWIDVQNLTGPYDLHDIQGSTLLSNLSISSNTDTDLFKFTIDGAGVQGDYVRIDFSNSEGDLDLKLLDQNGNLLNSSETTADYEQISLAGLAQGTYEAEVYGYEGATNPRYSLSIVAPTPPTKVQPDGFEPNNTIANATDLSYVSGAKTLSASISSTTDQDFYKFTTTSTGTANDSLSIQFQGAQGALNLGLVDQNGTPISGYSATTSTNNDTISLNNLPQGTYYAQVSGQNGATNYYQLHLNAPTVSTPATNDWTIMVYMTGSNLDDYAYKSIEQMELATAQFPGKVNFVVLWDQSTLDTTSYPTGGGSQVWSGQTGRAVIQPNFNPNSNTVMTTFDTSIGKQDTGASSTLANFITWAKGAAPAKQYGLVLWDHGGGELGGFNVNNQGNPNNTTADELNTSKLDSALQTSNTTPDLIAFDECLMSTAEVGYALVPYTKDVVASEEVENAGGYDYSTAFSSLYNNPDLVNANDLASGLVSSYQSKYQSNSSGWNTLAATNTAQFNNFITALKAFTDAAIAITDPNVWKAINAARNAATSFFGESYTRDLGQFLQAVSNNPNLSSLKTVATNAYNALESVILAKTSDNRDTQGLAIYFPDTSTTIDSGYQTLNQAFLTSTDWLKFLTTFRTQVTSSNGVVGTNWAGNNNIAAYAYNFHTLIGHGYTYTGLNLPNATAQEWYRFQIKQTGTSSDNVQITYNNSNSQSLSLSLYQSGSDGTRTQVGQTSNTGSGTETVSLAGLSSTNEYWVQVNDASGTTPPPTYSLSINAPGTVAATDTTNGNDWVQGNDKSTKAYDLGTITSESVFTSLMVSSTADDWFSLETPKNQIVNPGTVYINIAGNNTVKADLFKQDGTTLIQTTTGTGKLQFQYPSGAGQTYLLKISQPSAPTGYYLDINPNIATSIPTQLPDLTPYQPTGWDAPLVVNTTVGSRTTASQITTVNQVYIDWAEINQGTAATANPFNTTLSLNGVVIGTWQTNPPLNPNYYTYIKDDDIGSLPAGTYTFTLTADPTNQVQESNKNNNVYQKTLTVTGQGLPDLTPYQPTGWDSPLVTSTQAGTYTSASQITTSNQIYIDWAVINQGTVDVTNKFYTTLSLDGVVIQSWQTNPLLNPSYYTYVKDDDIGTLKAGTHTLTLTTDSTNQVQESNKSNNVYQKTFTVVQNSSSVTTSTYEPNLDSSTSSQALIAQSSSSLSTNTTQISTDSNITGNASSSILNSVTSINGSDHDLLTGTSDSNRFIYQNLNDSLLSNYNVITNFNANSGKDLFVINTAPQSFENVGEVTSLDETGISAKLTAADFLANGVAEFTFGTHTFVAINDNTSGFNANSDAVIDVTGLKGTLSLANFVAA